MCDRSRDSHVTQWVVVVIYVLAHLDNELDAYTSRRGHYLNKRMNEVL